MAHGACACSRERVEKNRSRIPNCQAACLRQKMRLTVRSAASAGGLWHWWLVRSSGRLGRCALVRLQGPHTEGTEDHDGARKPFAIDGATNGIATGSHISLRRRRRPFGVALSGCGPPLSDSSYRIRPPWPGRRSAVVLGAFRARPLRTVGHIPPSVRQTGSTTNATRAFGRHSPPNIKQPSGCRIPHEANKKGPLWRAAPMPCLWRPPPDQSNAAWTFLTIAAKLSASS